MKRLIPHRRVILGLLGTPFIVLGIAILRQEEPTFGPATSLGVMAHSLFGWLWITAGALAIVAMIASETRKVIEEVGYGLLFLPPFVWMSAYLTVLAYGGGFFYFVGFLFSTTIVVLILYLARYMRNG
jgi:bacteriorhodopsin